MITIHVAENTPSGEYNLAAVTPPVIPIPQPVLRYPTGKGYYVWIVKQCRNGDIAAIVDSCLEAKINFLAVKIQNGTAGYNTNSPLSRLFLALNSAGVKVWGWGYEYAIKPRDEALAAAKYTKDLGVEGFIIDIEGEYKNKPSESRTFCDTLKENLDKPIGLASYRYPNLHMDISWNTFLSICDFHNPQVYWQGATLPSSPSQQLKKSIVQLKALRDLPVIPIGVASPSDPPSTWVPTVAQIKDFYHAAFAVEKCPGACYWSWQHAEKVQAWWDAIAAPLWG